MNYPGVSFLFEDDGPAAEGAKSASPGKDDRFREVRRVIVSQSHPELLQHDILDEVGECAPMSGSIRKASIKVLNQ